MGSAIVAGIESGWVNPVINREYALEEVQQVRILIEYSNCKEGPATSGSTYVRSGPRFKTDGVGQYKTHPGYTYGSHLHAAKTCMKRALLFS